jgi:hypothetical protein
MNYNNLAVGVASTIVFFCTSPGFAYEVKTYSYSL